MDKYLDYYYWMSSDWAYFGNPRMADIASRYGLCIRYRPVDMFEVYKQTGGIVLPLRSKERQSYRFVEMRRFSDILGMPIVLEPSFPPQNLRLPSCFVIAANLLGLDQYDLNHSIMTAHWVNDEDMEDPAVLVAAANAVGLDGSALLTRAQDQETQNVYAGYTAEAIGRGVFGAPFYFYNNQPFWGQDRLTLLEEEIMKQEG